jgi:hypothetical protein
MATTLTDLVPLFHSESTEVWIRAARAIGALGPEALPLLRTHLAGRLDIHARRHAWCALASYLDATRADHDDPELELLVGSTGENLEKHHVRSFVRRLLVGAILEGHRELDRPLGDFVGLPDFRDLRESKVAKLEVARDQKRVLLERVSNEQARRGIERNVAQLEEAIAAWSDDATPLADLQRLPRSEARLPQQPVIQQWSFGSLLSGLTLTLLDELGVPVALLAPALAELAAPGGDRIAFVKNLPRLFLDNPRPQAAPDPVLPDVLAALTRRIPSVAKGPVHWVEYVLLLRELAASCGVALELPPGQGLDVVEPPEIRAQYVAWMAEPREASALALARACEACFEDSLRWAELSHEARLVLPIFHMAMVAPTQGRKDSGQLGLGHRLELLRTFIHRWQDSNPEILAVLVRTWKLLLNEELTQAPSSPESMPVYLRHIRWIEPLVARWNLRSIVLKDLATIAARALCACYQACPPVDEPAARNSFNELLYTILHALPEFQLLREMALYSAPVPEVASLLSDILGVLGQDGEEARERHWESFLAATWHPGPSRSDEASSAPGRDDVDELVRVLGDPAKHMGVHLDEQADWTRALAWMVGVRARARLITTSGVTGMANKVFRQEIDAQLRDEIRDTVAQIDRLVEEIIHVELSLREPGFDVDAVGALRNLIERLRELERCCRESLPVLERRLVVDSLSSLRERHERRCVFLSSVLEGEHEERAMAALGLQDPEWGHYQPPASEYEAHRGEQGLIVRWMVGRQMLRELSGGSRVLRLLTSPWEVGLWIGVPYALCVLFNLADRYIWKEHDLAWIAGLPFALAPLAGLVLVAAYLIPKGRHFERKDRASMLIPHMVGALFLGIMERFAADEHWSLAFESNPVIRWLNIGIFLAASIFFVRFVMLRTQSPQPRGTTTGKSNIDSAAVLRRRTGSLLAIGFWVSFLFITIYSMLMGGVMAGVSRANIAAVSLDQLGPMAAFVDAVIPNRIQVPLIPGYLVVPVFPWAILTWTVQLFFFSAIFERIMNRES